MISIQYIPAYAQGTESCVLVGGRQALWGLERASTGPKSSHCPHPQLSNPLLGSFGRTPLVSASLLIECGSQAALTLPNDAVREKCTPKKPLGIHVARNLTRAIFIYCFIYLHAFFVLVLAHMLRTGEIFITKDRDYVFSLSTS